MHDTNISVVIPVYNSQDSLKSLSSRLTEVLAALTARHEIILVNDGSVDDSWNVILELVRDNPNARGINLNRNYGQHNALLAGIRAANYELVVTIDDDLQHPPEEIVKMLEKLNEGYDVVYGSAKQEVHGFLRDIASKMTKLAFYSVMNVEIAPKVSAYRIFRTSLREGFKDFQGSNPCIDVLLTWSTTKFSWVAVKHDPRTTGVSNYTFKKLFCHAMNMMTGFSTIPLRIASLLGFIFTLFGIGVFLYVVIRYMIYGTPVQGFTFLASVISIFSGVQLFVIGIFGEYLARMYSRIMERPTYMIRGIVHNKETCE